MGIVPKNWRTASIVPVFKKGDKSNAANHRPVSLTAICCKMQEHIIQHVCSNIMDHLSTYQILSDCQHGFRARRSCETQLITTIQDLAKNLSEGKQIDAVLLDFSKAFDKVPRQRLLLKQTLWYTRQHTTVDRTLLTEPHSTGTSRLDSLCHLLCRLWSTPRNSFGSLLFLLFINDLPDIVKSNVRLFADDCLLYRVINTKTDQLHYRKI
jgi:hypothetical protein